MMKYTRHYGYVHVIMIIIIIHCTSYSDVSLDPRPSRGGGGGGGWGGSALAFSSCLIRGPTRLSLGATSIPDNMSQYYLNPTFLKHKFSL